MTASTSETAGITDEGVARLRARIGVPEPHPQPPHYLRPNEDAFRHVAIAYGDDNPLWCYPDYARRSRWEGSFAPPPLVGGDTLIGEDEVTEIAPEHRDLMKGDPLRGVHAYYASSVREWWAPLRPGHRVRRRNALVGVLDKESDFAARAVYEWTASVFQTDDGAMLAGQYRNMVRTEREKARERKRDATVEVAQWTEEEIAELDEQYRAEAGLRRGAEPRYWEDVEEEDEFGPLVKGPLTVTDIICWHVGMGMGLYGVRPLRLAWQRRQQIPRFYHRDPQGIPDVMQRVHWDPEYARKAGNLTTYDYGRMRETWLIHLCTDWMGDDGWLWRLDCEFRKFNYVGDVQWMRGRVTRKYLAEGGRPAVDVDVWGESQRGEITAPGHATVLLPSREHGAVRLPDPPGNATNLEGALAAIAERFEER